MSLFVALILLATDVIDGEIPRREMVGVDGVKLIDAVALFISLVSLPPFHAIRGAEWMLIGVHLHLSGLH